MPYGKILTRVFAWLIVCGSPLVAADAPPGQPQPELVEVRKIWDHAPHNAFTDLVRWRDKFYCAFREGQGHAGDIGKLRVLWSKDGDQWQSAELLSMEEYDLRDAALSVTPDDRLMVLGGAQQVRDGRHFTGTFVSFSDDGEHFTAPRIVVPLGRWLWRVTWHNESAFGVSYSTGSDRSPSALHVTKDGLHYETIVPQLAREGWPTEARLRFAEDGTCYCLHRRDSQQPHSALLGVARPPYHDWQWLDLGRHLGGPNFLQLPTGQWIAAGRFSENGPRTELAHLDVKQGKLTPLLRLPSGGDTSYPGLVWHDGLLWISYYSSHEGQTSIYLAKVRFSDSSRQAAP